MISKTFTNNQAMEHLSYAITCGFSFEKFISGKGLYGNRVSLMRDKSPSNMFGTEFTFKQSSFHIIEGIKALEIPQTILITRKKLEEFYTQKEDMLEFFENNKQDFLSQEDIENLAKIWFEDVSTKLLVSKVLDFKKLNNFVVNQMVLKFPMTLLQKVAEFRKKQILILLTQEIINPDFAEEQINLLPASQDKLLDLKQKLLLQKKANKKA